MDKKYTKRRFIDSRKRKRKQKKRGRKALKGIKYLQIFGKIIVKLVICIGGHIIDPIRAFYSVLDVIGVVYTGCYSVYRLLNLLITNDSALIFLVIFIGILVWYLVDK